MNYTVKEWNLLGKVISLKRNYDDYFKEVTWIVTVFGEDFHETRLYKSRNAAMNFIRGLFKKFKEDLAKARQFATDPDKFFKREDLSYNEYIKKFFDKKDM